MKVEGCEDFYDEYDRKTLNGPGGSFATFKPIVTLKLFKRH